MARVLTVLLSLSLFACADVGEAPSADTTAEPVSHVDAAPMGVPVPIDTAESRIEWTAAKVTRTHEGGFARFEGSIYLDGDVVTGADVVAETESVFADVDRLTEHLKADEFLHAAEHPEVRFQVTELTPIPASDDTAGGAATHRASGRLTMRGRTNQVAFPLTISTSEDMIAADADFIINRHDWGVSYRGAPDDLVSDEVRVRLHIVAPRPRPAQ